MSIPHNVLPFSEYFDSTRPVNYQVTQTTVKQKKLCFLLFPLNIFFFEVYLYKATPYLFCILNNLKSRVFLWSCFVFILRFLRKKKL